MATYYAEQQQVKAVETSDDTIAKMASTASSVLVDKGLSEGSQKIGDSINAMFMQREGGALTSGDVDTLKLLGDEGYKAIWESLSDDMKAIY
jgi:hypothetical protein